MNDGIRYRRKACAPTTLRPGDSLTVTLELGVDNDSSDTVTVVGITYALLVDRENGQPAAWLPARRKPRRKLFGRLGLAR